MKKLFIVIMSCFMLNTHGVAQKFIPFSTQIIDRDAVGNQTPKSPIQPPIVCVEDFTLSFVADHPDYLLTIKDEDGEEVYSATVYSVETEVILPSSLSGTYQIELIMGNWRFIGEIVL